MIQDAKRLARLIVEFDAGLVDLGDRRSELVMSYTLALFAAATRLPDWMKKIESPIDFR